MKTLYKLYDTEFPYKGINNKRRIVRCFLYNDRNEVFLLHIEGTDSLGYRCYYETPGGGIEPHESKLTSLKREILEETGYNIINIKPLYKVIDYYNNLSRKNITYYYYAFATTKEETHLLDYEKKLFKESKFYNINEAINLYNNVNSLNKFGRIIKSRELDLLKLSYELIKEN